MGIKNEFTSLISNIELRTGAHCKEVAILYDRAFLNTTQKWTCYPTAVLLPSEYLSICLNAKAVVSPHNFMLVKAVS